MTYVSDLDMDNCTISGRSEFLMRTLILFTYLLYYITGPAQDTVLKI